MLYLEREGVGDGGWSIGREGGEGECGLPGRRVRGRDSDVRFYELHLGGRQDWGI